MDFQLLGKIIGGIVSGWFGHKEKKRRVSQLQSEVKTQGVQYESTNITLINSTILTNNPPPDRGDVNTTRAMTQSEHDALRLRVNGLLYFPPTKEEQLAELLARSAKAK